MEQQKFDSLVLQALEALPEEFRDKLENVDVVVEDWPSVAQLKRLNLRSRSQLLGLYEGVPRTTRGQGYNLVLPDKITIFKEPIEMICRTEKDIEVEIGKVVKHEIAHHFGIGDDTLRRIERGRNG
jgi:predicted Zn-dependent protease with MMP-like domain